MTGTIALASAAPIVAGLAGLTYVTVAPASQFWGPVISRGKAGSNQVALTFDDGPTPGCTDRVLDALAKADAKATFFVVGCNASEHPALLRRIRDEGHLLANHTMRHSHYGVMRTFPYWFREIGQAEDVVRLEARLRMALFRPPMGVKTWHVARAVRELGYTLVTWSRRAMDGLPTTSQRIVDRLGGATDGEILLLHDGVEPHAPHRDRSATIEAIVPLIERLRARGLGPVRLDKLLGLKGYQVPRQSTGEKVRHETA
jgi:peptidoglycan/xylan/chitin deacetylase (PgdA/CDA1 family)